MPNAWELTQYKKGYHVIIGCDEAGRGALCGPVVAAAVILNPKFVKRINNAPHWYQEIADSKTIRPQKRSELSDFIKEYAIAWAVSEVAPSVIDKVNIHHASLQAMRDAVVRVLNIGAQTSEEKLLVAVDGKFMIPELAVAQIPVVKGDTLITAVSAASILAKVHRDQIMVKLHEEFPAYNFKKHKGYGTVEHRDALSKLGLSPVHRVTFCDAYVTT